MKKVLLIKTSSMGDVIHNLPVVNDILTHIPDAQIDWVAEESFADIPRLHPQINRVFPIAIRRWRKHLGHFSTYADIKSRLSALRHDTYDAVIDTQGLIKSALITAYCRGTTFGFDATSARETQASWTYNKRLHVDTALHAVTRNRLLVAKALNYTFDHDAPIYGLEPIANTTHTLASQNHYVMGFHATSRDSKLWPIDYWIAFGKQLEVYKLNLLLGWGSESERSRAEYIAHAIPNTAIVLPKMSLPQFASIIRKAKFSVGVDTGLTHLAVALKCPTIALYTDTDPRLTGILPESHVAGLNLGGKKNIPSPEKVISCLEELQLLNHSVRI